MSELKPVNCGCGGEAKVKKHTFYRALPLYSVKCDRCGIQVPSRNTESEAIMAWNRAMGAKDINVPDKERTVKVENIVRPHGYPAEGNCGNCGDEVNGLYEYCPSCGARLEWE